MNIAKNLNKQYSVAVITRTKDRPLMLERAIRSIAAQTFDDFIMVIVNDGGDQRILEQVVKKHENLLLGRVMIIHNKSSIGMQAASNKAIKSINSIFVAIHDDDDTWNEKFLEKSIDHLEKTKGMGVVVSTDFVNEEIDGDKIKIISKNRLHEGLTHISLYKMCGVNYAAPISFLYRRSVFKEIGYYDKSLGGVGDWDFALRFLLKYDIEFLNTSKALAYYHHRPKARGIDANSVYTETHKSLEGLLANKYLRKDLESGKLGLGYIMNNLLSEDQREKRIIALEERNRHDQLQPIANILARQETQLSNLEKLFLKSLVRSVLTIPKRSVRRIRRKAQKGRSL